MDEGVHVRGGQVMLLVPGRRRQHHVGVQGVAGHAEIEGEDEIDLPDRSLIPPLHVPGTELRGRLLLGRRGVTPSRCRKKYWSPLADEPRVFARQIDQIRGKFSGASGSSAAKEIEPSLSRWTRYGIVSCPASAA